MGNVELVVVAVDEVMELVVVGSGPGLVLVDALHGRLKFALTILNKNDRGGT